MKRAASILCLAVLALNFAGCTPDATKQAVSSQVNQVSDAYSTNSNRVITNSAPAGDDLDSVVPQAQPPAKGEDIAVITTSMGVMKMRFFPEEAPNSVANFKELAKKGYYNGLIFHRVIEGFVIQTGDPTGTGTGGQSSTGKAIKDEKNSARKHIFGAVGMAKAGPNTATSQFYVVVNPAGTSSLNGNYTVFAQVFDGLSVAEDIAKVDTKICDVPALGCDKPLKDVTMQKVEIVPFEG